MQVSVRSYLTAGVAFVGAGAIAVSPISPITPALPDVQIPASAASTMPVELAALVNPFELWFEVFATTAGNIGQLADIALTNPAPILANILNNQFISAGILAEVAGVAAEGFLTGVADVPASIQSGIDMMLAGNIQDGFAMIVGSFITPVVQAAFPILLGPLFGELQGVIRNPLVNALAVVDTVVSAETLVTVGLPLLVEVIAPLIQIGVTGQAIYDGFQARDWEAVANAIISFPSDVVNTFLNGSDNPTIGNSGLLGVPNGLIASLLGLRQAIADVITPPAPPPSPFSTLAIDEIPSGSVESAFVTADLQVEGGLDAVGLNGEGIDPTAEGEGGGGGDVPPPAGDLEPDPDPEPEPEPEPATSARGAQSGAEEVILNSGNKFTPTTLAGERNKAGQKALESIGNDVRAGLNQVGNDIKNALGLGKTNAESSSGADESDGDDE